MGAPGKKIVNLIVQFNAIALMFAGLYAMLDSTLSAVFVTDEVPQAEDDESPSQKLHKDLSCLNTMDKQMLGGPVMYPILFGYFAVIVIWLLYMVKKTESRTTPLHSIAWVRNWAMIKKDKCYKRFVKFLVLTTVTVYVGLSAFIFVNMNEPDMYKPRDAGLTALFFGFVTVMLSLFSLYSPNAETILIGEEAGSLKFDVPFYSNSDRVWEIITDGVIAARMGDNRLLEHYGMTTDEIGILLKHVNINDDLGDFGIDESCEDAKVSKVELVSDDGLTE